MVGDRTASMSCRCTLHFWSLAVKVRFVPVTVSSPADRQCQQPLQNSRLPGKAAQGVKDFAQVMAALRRSLFHQRQIRAGETPFFVADVRRVGLAGHHRTLASLLLQRSKFRKRIKWLIFLAFQAWEKPTARTVVAWSSAWEIRLFVRRFFHPRLVSLGPRLSPRCARKFPRACGFWRARVLP